MPKPTEAELKQKLADLMHRYEQELDTIFSSLETRVEKIELPPVQSIQSKTEPSKTEPKIEPPKIEPKIEPKATPPKAEPPKKVQPDVHYVPTPQSVESLPEKPKFKLPRWRDTWRYQGLKGLASRVWRGTNPDQDIAWKYASEVESLFPHLTLQEYLELSEVANDCVDYYFVIEEAVHPEIIKAFADAKEEIRNLVRRFLIDAHKLGVSLGDLSATTRFMFPPKQQFLFDKTPDKKPILPTDQNKKAVTTDELEPVVSPELSRKNKEGKEKKIELPIIENPDEKHSEILRPMMDRLRWESLGPFKPWTWFKWAKKPSNIYKKFPNAQEALLQQWQDQAGKKFIDKVEDGLANMFLAFYNGWFGDIDYTNNKVVATTISNLIGKKIEGSPRPWTDFIRHFGNESSAEEYLSKQSVNKPSRENPPSKPELPVMAADSSVKSYEDDSGSYSD